MAKWREEAVALKEPVWRSEAIPIDTEPVFDPAAEDKRIKDSLDISEKANVPIVAATESHATFQDIIKRQDMAWQRLLDQPRRINVPFTDPIDPEDPFPPRRNIFAVGGMGGFAPGITRETAIDVPVRPGKTAGEIAKGLTRFTENIAGTLGGTAQNWLGQFIEHGGKALDDFTKLGSKNKDQIYNPYAESIMAFGRKRAQIGRESRQWWSFQSQTGWERLDPQLKETDPISYGAGKLTEGVASSGLSVLAVYLSGGVAAPAVLNKGIQINRGLLALSGLSAAAGFEHAQATGENFLWSTAAGLADGTIEYAMESTFLEGVGKGRGALTAGFKEGGEEFATGMLQNTRATMLENEKEGMSAYEGAKDAIVKFLKQSPWEVAAGFIGGYGIQGGANLVSLTKKANALPIEPTEEVAEPAKAPAKPVTPAEPTITPEATAIERQGVAALQKEGSLKGITDEEALNIIRADTTDSEEAAVKQILESRGIDTKAIDVTTTPRGDAITDEAGLALEAHADAVNRAVDEAMNQVRDVKEQLLPELAKAQPPAPAVAPEEGAVEVFHAGDKGIPTKLIGHKGLHFGTEAAATQRAEITGRDVKPTKATLNIKSPYLPEGQMLDERTPEGRTEIFSINNLESKRKQLAEQGFDVVPYINAIEDVGSVSYIVLDPSIVSQPPAPAEVKPKRDILGEVEPIFQINKALKEAVEIRPKVEKERKAELRKRVGAAAGALKSSLLKRKLSAEESIGRSTGLLKGPLSNARFSSIRDVMEDAMPGAVDTAFRSIGESTKLKYFEIIETKEAFAKLIDGIPITLRQVDMIKKHFGIEMGEIARERAEKSTVSDRAFALWRAGLLTGLKTSMLNTMSNLTHALTETAKDVIAAPVDILVKQFTGKRTVGFTFKGIPKGVKEGVTKGWEYLTTGISERDIGKKLDYVPVNFGNSKIGRASQVYVETIFHLMGAEDQPFFYGAMSRSIRSQAIAQGRNEGLKGQEFNDFVEKTRLAPTGEMLENATHDAEMAVFQNRTVLGDIASHIQKAPVVRWTVPFSRTPSAVAMQIINYTPVGAFKEVFSQIHKGEFNQRAFSQAIGRSVVGIPALATGALLLAKGLMTLDFPKGERERKLWELEGKKPFAIKIGDKWRSTFVLGPIGNVLIIGAYFQKAFNESGSPSEAMVTALSGGGKSFSEQTFVIGMSRAIDAIKDPERSFDRFFTGMAGSFVPTIVADVARATDYTERTYKGPWQGVVNRIPVARTTLEERVDVFGQDLPRYGGNPLEVMIDASRPVKIRQDVVVDELKRLWNKNVKVAPTQLGNRDGYDSLTQEENTVLWRRSGEVVYQGLFELIRRGSYKKKGDEAKGKMIERVVKEAKDDARAEAASIKLNQGMTMEELKESGLVTSDVEPLIRRRR